VSALFRVRPHAGARRWLVVKVIAQTQRLALWLPAQGGVRTVGRLAAGLHSSAWGVTHAENLEGPQALHTCRAA